VGPSLALAAFGNVVLILPLVRERSIRDAAALGGSLAPLGAPLGVGIRHGLAVSFGLLHVRRTIRNVRISHGVVSSEFAGFTGFTGFKVVFESYRFGFCVR
jgi:hypothetical protein